MIQVCDLMSRAVSTASPDWTLTELAAFFAEEQVQGAPVVDDKGVVIGVVSMTDLVAAIGGDESFDTEPVFGVFNASGRWEPLTAHLSRGNFPNDDQKVTDVMTRDPITATPEATVGEVATLMLEYGIHRLIITDGKTLRGIVTSTDLLAALVRYEEKELQAK